MQTNRITPVVFALAVLAMGGCGTSRATLDRLAAAGAIDERAPLQTHRRIEIAAPAARIWKLIVNARSWPDWQKDIENVTVPGRLTTGMRFSWSTGGTRIESQVQLCDPPNRLSWTGSAWTAKAVHVWELQPASGDRTWVTVKESMDGPLISRLYSSGQLSESIQRWLTALKDAAEQRR
jgi:uncharacterized protein YndB with AHSA1/START domain